jgi:nucleoside-diphosphate-sugar epimerase
MARDYTYINDVVTGILLVLDYQKPFDYWIFNLSSGRPPIKASQLPKEIK